MSRARRRFSTFSLSFLDVMSCGFGATILVFLIMDHATQVHSEQVNEALLSETNFLEREVEEGREDLAELRNTIALLEQAIVEARGRASEITEQIRRRRVELDELQEDSRASEESIKRLQDEIRELEEQRQELAAAVEEQTGSNVRRFIDRGDGDRQYLTGLRLGGQRILILLDASASMLDRTIVNVIRLRNMPESVRRKAPKWESTVKIIEWLTAQLPASSSFQLVTFNTEAGAILPDSEGEWLAASDRQTLDAVVESVRELVPTGGTSLARVFAAVAAMDPAPDNIFLITDGLPTQGKTPGAATTVSGRARLRHFTDALPTLPRGIPVNVILLPMEGDPMAASAFWQLAQDTNGAFVAPSRDWP